MFGLFGNSSWNRLEKKFRRDKPKELCAFGLPLDEARQMVEMLIDQVNEGANADLKSLQSNIGDVVLHGARAESPLAESLKHTLQQTLPDKMARDGVTKADFLWWWNLHPFEKQYMITEDEFFRCSIAIEAIRNGLESGKSDDESKRLAWRKVGRHFVFGNYIDVLPYWEEEGVRYLPWELKQRVNNWVGTISDPECHRVELERAGAMNTLIREKIFQGAL